MGLLFPGPRKYVNSGPMLPKAAKIAIILHTAGVAAQKLTRRKTRGIPETIVCRIRLVTCFFGRLLLTEQRAR